MAAQPGISLLLSDVDGTLLTHAKELTPRARRAVLRLRERNIRFAITSARPPLGMAMFVDPLALAEPLAAFNGGVYAQPDLSVLESHALATDAARSALELIDCHGLGAWLYTRDGWYVRDVAAAHVAKEAKAVGFGPEPVEDLASLAASAIKIVGVSDDPDRMRRAQSDIAAALAGDSSVSRSQPYYLDITNPFANKGAVARYHASRLGIPLSAIATIGDMPSDTLMFAESGFSIAMGNAAPDVKSKASAVTDSCDDDGFAKAVETYLLGES